MEYLPFCPKKVVKTTSPKSAEKINLVGSHMSNMSRITSKNL